MTTTFNNFVNNTYATLASTHTAGSTSLVLGAGQGAQFGSTFPMLVTVITAASYRSTAETLTIFTVTGRTADTLTVSATPAEATTDPGYAAGAIVELRWTAGEANRFSTSINALESAGGGLAIGSPVTGGANSAILYENTSGNLTADSSLTYDGYTTLTFGGNAGVVHPFIKCDASGFMQFCAGQTYNYYFFQYLNAAAGFISAGTPNEIWIGSVTSNAPIMDFVGTNPITAISKTASSAPFAVQGAASQTAPLFYLEQISSTSTARNCGIIDATFNTSTDASWSGNLLLYAGDFTSSNAGKRLGIQIQSNGSVALLGHYGVTPVVQPATTGTTTGFTANTGTAVQDASTFTGNIGATAYRINDVVRALKQLGLLAQ